MSEWLQESLAAARPGEPGSGGYYSAWPENSRDGQVAEHIEFQFAGMDHQANTALAGMWLFLVTEVLFFGGLFLIYVIYRAGHPAGIAIASRHTELAIGTINTLLLVTSSAVYSHGLACARRGENGGAFWASLVTLALGVGFLLLKGFEWKNDLDQHLFPGSGFAITGPASGAAQLFWSFYFMATGLHGLHMLVGIGLVGWIAWMARRQTYSPGYYTPVEVVGLYWSFVDMIWLVLYPVIYLVDRSG